MSLLERKAGQRDVVDKWISANLQSIMRIMGEERETRIAYHLVDCSEAPEYFGFNQRWLSEMPLCRSLKNVQVEDYTYCQDGHVLVTKGLEEATDVAHGFLYRKKDDTIICLTPGLFMHPEITSLRPGDRIRELKRLAPKLVSIYDHGITILHGTRSEIKSQLGFEYSPKSHRRRHPPSF